MAKTKQIKKPKVKRPKPGYLWINRLRARRRARAFDVGTCEIHIHNEGPVDEQRIRQLIEDMGQARS